MADHDPLCPGHLFVLADTVRICICDNLAKARADQDVKSRADEREKIAAATTRFFDSTVPPYLWPDNEDVLFPTMEQTTVNDAVREIWRVARDAATRLARDGGG